MITNIRRADMNMKEQPMYTLRLVPYVRDNSMRYQFLGTRKQLRGISSIHNQDDDPNITVLDRKMCRKLWPTRRIRCPIAWERYDHSWELRSVTIEDVNLINNVLYLPGTSCDLVDTVLKPVSPSWRGLLYKDMVGIAQIMIALCLQSSEAIHRKYLYHAIEPFERNDYETAL